MTDSTGRAEPANQLAARVASPAGEPAPDPEPEFEREPVLFLAVLVDHRSVSVHPITLREALGDFIDVGGRVAAVVPAPSGTVAVWSNVGREFRILGYEVPRTEIAPLRLTTGGDGVGDWAEVVAREEKQQRCLAEIDRRRAEREAQDPAAAERRRADRAEVRRFRFEKEQEEDDLGLAELREIRRLLADVARSLSYLGCLNITPDDAARLFGGLIATPDLDGLERGIGRLADVIEGRPTKRTPKDATRAGDEDEAAAAIEERAP